MANGIPVFPYSSFQFNFDHSIVVEACALTTPAVSAAANPGNSITAGTSVTFTATPTNGGLTPSYQWKKNNVNVGANSPTYTDAALADGDVIEVEMTSNDPCASPTTATSNEITMTVSPPSTPGAALHFDGVDDHIPTNLVGSSGNSPRTVEAWINTSNTTSNGCVLDWGDQATSRGFFRLIVTNDGRLRIAFNSGSPAFFQTSPLNLNDGNWHYVAVTYHHLTQEVTIYIDNAMAQTTFPTPLNTVANEVYIGRTRVGTSPFAGTIDEVRIWDRALSACEINNNKNCELFNPTQQPGLLAYYQFNQGVAAQNNAGLTTLADASGNNQTGTLTNFALDGPTSNWVEPGGVTTGNTCNSAFFPPTVFNVTGGGSFCTGSNGVSVGLEDSETGVSYELLINDTPTGNTVEGTGAAISFGLQTTAGTYTVNATLTASGCVYPMTGSADVAVNTPTVPFPHPFYQHVSGITSYGDSRDGGIAYGDGKFVAVFSHYDTGGYIFTSTDGVNWTEQTSPGGVFGFEGIYYANGQFLMSGLNGFVYTSPDGINWTARNTGSSNGYPGIVFANGTWLLAGANGTLRQSTDNGVTWTNVTSPAGVNWYSATYGNGVFVISGLGNRMFASSDLVNWTPWDLYSSSFTALRVTFGGGKFVAVHSSGAIYTSTNGINWTPQPSGSANSLHAVAYLNGEFFASTPFTQPGQLLNSTNGSCWETQPTGFPYGFESMAFGNGIYAAISMDGNIFSTVCHTPVAFQLTSINGCSEGSGAILELSDSEINYTYQLEKDGSAIGAPVPGNAASLLFTGLTEPGSYTVSATSLTGGCNAAMTGSATVVPGELPVVSTVPPSCPDEEINLSATSSVSSINWYDDETGGNLLGNSASGENLPLTLSQPGTFYAQIAGASIGTASFQFTGNVQTFTVPEGVTSIRVIAKGAAGSDGYYEDGPPGEGGTVTTDLAVTPGQVLNIYVGGLPTGEYEEVGGYNGGGSSLGQYYGAGGGATDIRIGGTALSNRVIVAGGGGGAGYDGTGGGNGGGLVGEAGDDDTNYPDEAKGGGGGTQSAGGAGGFGNDASGYPGTLGQGGDGADYDYYGAGGGGGYYGGGGGGEGTGSGYVGGGGGGSSYTDPLLCTNVVHQQGGNSGNGIVFLNWGEGCISPDRVPVVVEFKPIPTNITVSNVSAADCKNTTCTTDDTFTADVTVTFASIPTSGTLSLTGPTIVGTVPPVDVADIDVSGANSISVSGFTDSNDNGTYTPDGTAGGATRYTNGVCELKFDGANWAFQRLGALPFTLAVQYFGNATTVPCSNWVTFGFGNPVLTGACDGNTGTLSYTFTGVTMKADGNNIDLTAAFSEGCSYQDEAVAVAPACSGLTCGVTGILLSNTGSCNDNGTINDADDYFTTDVTVTFAYAPSGGTLTLKRGTTVLATTTTDLTCVTSYIFEDVQIASDGQSVVLTAEFSTNCTFTSGILMNAPEPCSCQPTSAFTDCPSALALNVAPGTCSAIATYSPTANGDPAPLYSYTFSGATTGSGDGTGSGSTFEVGITTVTITAANACGTAVCSFDVTVTDNIPPSITCPAAQTLVLGPNCTAALPDYRSLANTGDNCGVQGVTQSPPAGTTVSNAGDITLTLTVTDINGNSSECTFPVSKVDNTPPTVQCFNQTLIFNGEASFSLNTDDLTDATDNCGVQSITLSPNIIYSEQVGQGVPVVATVTDINGNVATCTSQITVSGLPSGWSQQADGIGCAGGNNNTYNSANGVWTATSTNCFYGPPFTSDAASFAQRTLCGNGSITAQVTSINGTALGWAGVVMRESNAPGAKKAQLMTNLSTLSRREFRTATNGQAYPQQFPSQSRYWLRITRAGNQFVMYISPNGTAWYVAGTQNIEMGNCIQMGLVVTNYTANSTVTATFANVSFTGSNAGLGSGGTDRAESIEQPYSFEVYPNPTSGELNVDLSQYIGRSVRMEVYSMEGKLLQFSEIEEVQTVMESLSLAPFENGMYLVKVKSAGLPDITKRVVLARE